MKILGISAFYHDAAAAIIEDGKILAAAQEERFTRKKFDASFPINALRFCLSQSKINLDRLDAIVFYDKPFLKFERLLETYYARAPYGVKSFITSMPVWIKEKLFLKSFIKYELKKVGPIDFSKTKLLFPEHHLSHAASAYYPSAFNEAAILTIDGAGEWATATICHGQGSEIKLIKQMNFPDSVGLLYSAFTYYLGFKVNSGEYKLMGLAPYGNHGSAEVKKFERSIRDKLVTIYDDGSIKLNQKYFDYATGLRMADDYRWQKLFGFHRRTPDAKLEQHHADLALAIQQVTEDIVLKMAAQAQRLTRSYNLCLAGGVALNCVANSRLRDAKIFDHIYVQPAAGDAGGALGAALAAEYIYFKRERLIDYEFDSMRGALLGPEYSHDEIKRFLDNSNANYETIKDASKLAARVADIISGGQVVGWFQGKMEWGPRALGARSIVADARDPKMQQKLNEKIKYREDFRPFAPAVLAEEAEEFFDNNSMSPYMLFTTDVNDKHKHKLPDNFDRLSLSDKLATTRSDIPAVTHLDYSARLQTVTPDTNPLFYDLIKAFRKQSGRGVIINTSFNVRGEPIVMTPSDAYRCFMRTGIDCLVMGHFIVFK